MLTEGAGYNEAPDFSPDGSTLIYAHSDVHEGEPGFATSLWLMDTDGSRQRPLPLDDGGGDDTEPEFSPDGRRIVFMRYRNDPQDRTVIYNVENTRDAPSNAGEGIWTVSAAGGRPTLLLGSTDEVHPYKPDYSPGGRRIVFGCALALRSVEHLCVMNADGSGVEQVVDGQLWENHVVWD